VSAWRHAWLARLDASGRYPGWVLFAVLSGMFATSFPFTILAVSLGPIAEEFGVRETTMSWVVTAPMLLSAVTFPLVGKLGDLYGHRRVFLWGFAGASAVAALTALAWDAFSLIGLRTVAAVLGGATQPTSMALLFAVNPKGGRVRAMGWWSMTAAGAPALGLIFGGPLVDWLGWRIVFLLQAGMSAAALAVAFAVLRETRPLRVRFDVLGALSLAVGVGGFMVALGGVRELGIASPWIAAAAAIGTLGLVAFVRIEDRVTDPLLSLELFRDRNFSATLVSNAFSSAAYMGAFIIAPLLLYQCFDFSITQTSLLMVLRTASVAFASPMGGALGERSGERAASVVGCAVMTLALLGVAWGAFVSDLFLLGVGLVGQGVGLGLSQPSITSAIARSVDESQLGIAAAANRLAGQGGASFGIAALTIVYGGLAEPRVFGLAFLLCAALAAASTLAALGIGGSRSPGAAFPTAASAEPLRPTPGVPTLKQRRDQ
jgi:MFS family permease